MNWFSFVPLIPPLFVADFREDYRAEFLGTRLTLDFTFIRGAYSVIYSRIFSIG